MRIAAALLLFVLAAVHSALGERMIFRRLGADATPPLDMIPIVGAPQPARTILHACWHLLSVFGIVFGLEIGWFVTDPRTLHLLTGMLAVSALLVLVWTRGKHLAWAAFVVAAVLTALGT